MKHNIKNKGILWTLVLVLLGSTSCHDFLYKLPENTVEAEEVDYSQLSEMYMPVSGVYGVARQRFSSWIMYALISVRGDDVTKGSSPTDQIELLSAKLFQYEDIKSFWGLNSAWGNLYGLVTVSNSALISLDRYKEYITSEADNRRYMQYTAEVRYLRALAYFWLVNLWGDVPLLLDNQQLNVTKAPVDDVYRYIFTELEYCIANLPAVRPNQQPDKMGAVTRYTAQMLYAKAQLYRGNWQAVLTATNDIIDNGGFSLYPDFYQLFKIPAKLSDESLFELQFTDFGAGSGDIVKSDEWFASQGPRGGDNPIQGWGLLPPTDEVRAYFHQRGETVRDTTSFLLTNHYTPSGDFIIKPQPGEPTAYNGKAYTPSDQLTPGRNNYGDNNNVRVFRYAEVLLMNAEAKIRLGQNGDAPLNLVRQRAGMPPLTGATLDDVLDERRVELALEWGNRYFDLVRTGRAAGTLTGFVAGKSEYYPIPQDQIDLNENLKEDAEPVTVY